GYWAQGYYDEPRLSFDAVYSYADFSAIEIAGQNQVDELINVIAFQSDNDELGNQEGMMGEFDDATGGATEPKQYRNKETAAAVEAAPDVQNMPEVMSNLDSTTTLKKPAFVSARAENRIFVDRSSISSITKQVASDAEGVYRTGTDDTDAGNGWTSHTNQVNVYEGHGYTYRVEVARGNGQTSGIVLYDALENYQLNEANSDYPIREQRWKGTLTGVDTSQITGMGVAPVVYYSTTVEGFDGRGAAGNSTNVGTVDDGDVINTLEKNRGAWVRADQYNGPLSAVKAVAIDCSKASNGTDDFVLPQGKSLIAYIHMRAPVEVKTGSQSDLFNKIAPANDEDEPNNNAHAFNNVYISSTVSGDSQVNTRAEFYHPDYVKVGILPYKIVVNKVWDDANNQDGKRPDKVGVELLANGQQAKFEDGSQVPHFELGGTYAGQSGYGDDGWSYTIEDIPYVDASGNPIRYTLREDAITEELDDHTTVNLYVPSYLRADDAHLQITNKRVPETVNLAVNKAWNDDGDAYGVRPSTIRLRLYADGVYMDTKT
ncbi:MAG: Cna B-type domain-containing protein, partial [Atopobiaceae bacterium]|nr:Cna B-type domain-containing protein [Atopobiaceae bacterium]